MVTAMAYPEAKRGRGNIDSAKSVFSTDISSAYVKHARYVLRNNPTPEGQQYPDLCLAVMAGTMTLTEAYGMTQEDVRQRAEEARVRNENLEKLAGIREQCQAPYQYHPVLIAGYARPKGLEGAGV